MHIDEIDKFIDATLRLPAEERKEAAHLFVGAVMQRPDATKQYPSLPLKGRLGNYHKPQARVVGPHGPGTVLGFNHNEMGYDGERYPYVVLFDSGYCDYYSHNDLKQPQSIITKIKQFIKTWT
jgi:hypothetical protein